jgi:two-component sensor histidine kinase
MPSNRPPPLTQVQIRSMFKDLNATVTNLVLSMAVVHDLLLTKKYVTDVEIATASARVRSEAKAAMAKLHKAPPRGPNGGAH